MANLLDTLSQVGGRVLDTAAQAGIAKLTEKPPPPAPTDLPKAPDPEAKALPPEPVKPDRPTPMEVPPMMFVVIGGVLLVGVVLLATRKKG